jgi:hypothetical protein
MIRAESSVRPALFQEELAMIAKSSTKNAIRKAVSRNAGQRAQPVAKRQSSRLLTGKGPVATSLFRVATSDRRIVAIEDGPQGTGQVTFGCHRSGSNRYRRMTLSAAEFLRRFLQHVLPSGFQKVRHYGCATATQRNAYRRGRWLVALAMAMGLVCALQATLRRDEFRPQVRCAECGGLMAIVGYSPCPAYFDTS